MKKLITILIATVFVGCTSNQMAKQFGGTTTVDLPSGRRLVNITWKGEADLWILTKEDTASKPAIYHFKEKSSLGLNEGEVIINETK